MILITAWTIGLAAGMTRSAATVAMVAAAIPFVFALAALTTPAVSWLGLGLALGGYNAGLLSLLGLAILTARASERRA